MKLRSCNYENSIVVNAFCYLYQGGPFFIEHDGKAYLRGIVSAALLTDDSLSCDNKNYAVFTDVSKYTHWIEGYLEQNQHF